MTLFFKILNDFTLKINYFYTIINLSRFLSLKSFSFFKFLLLGIFDFSGTTDGDAFFKNEAFSKIRISNRSSGFFDHLDVIQVRRTFQSEDCIDCQFRKMLLFIKNKFKSINKMFINQQNLIIETFKIHWLFFVNSCCFFFFSSNFFFFFKYSHFVLL